jgi:hypothetical protein
MRWVGTLLALAVLALGALWLLQGTGLLVIDPIACVGECQALRGASFAWSMAGIGLLVLAGGALAYIWRRR